MLVQSFHLTIQTHHEFSVENLSRLSFNIQLRDPRRSPSKKSFLIETLDESPRMGEADDQILWKISCSGHNGRSGDTLPPGSGFRLCWMGEIKTEACHLKRLVWVTSINSNWKNIWISLQGITRVSRSTLLLKLKQISSTSSFAQQEKHLATRHPPKHSISRIILQSPQLHTQSHHRITHHNPYETPSSKRLCSAAKRCDSKASFAGHVGCLVHLTKIPKIPVKLVTFRGYLGIPTFFQFSQQVDKTSCTGYSFNLTPCSELWSGKHSKWPDQKIKSLSKKVENWSKSQKESNHAAFVWSLTLSYTFYIDPAHAPYHKVWIFTFLSVPTPRAWPRRNFFTQISTEFLLAFHVAPIQKILGEKVPEFDTIEKKSVPPKVVISHNTHLQQ